MYKPKRKYKHLDLSYLIENSLGDIIFIKDILECSYSDFDELIEKLNLSLNDESSFDNQEFYLLLHKFKPSSIIYNVSVKNIFLEFGSNHKTISYEEMKNISPKIINCYTVLKEEIKEELEHIKGLIV